MDFHRTMNGTIDYISARYGEDFLKAIFRKTALHVYRSIHRDLASGRTDQLIEHWRYYLERENAKFCISRNSSGEIILEVKKCPAVDYLEKNSIRISPYFCAQTTAFNDAVSEGTPFRIESNVTCRGECVQTVRRRDA